MNRTAKILLTIGAGVAVGAALGILFAPDEGSETRKKLAKRSKRAVDDGLEQGTDSLEEIKDILQRQLNKVTRKIEQIKP